jgi:protein involved in polysaccharide export with SLBB domain
MYKHFYIKFSAVTILAFSATHTASAQNDGLRLSNNPFLPSPKGSIVQKEPDTRSVAATDGTQMAASVANAERRIEVSTQRVPPVRSLDPKEHYLIGAGDVLFISVENVPTSKGYYTVRVDGTIDLPLAGGDVPAAGSTAEELAFMLGERMRIFDGKSITATVREYGSHRINVLGLVDRSGDRFLQREAMPFFVIRAESGVDRRATHVVIKVNANAIPEVLALNDSKLDTLLITPGTTLEFVVESVQQSGGVAYLTGEVERSGPIELIGQMTLSRAVGMAGGANGKSKRAVVRRRGGNGSMTTMEYDLEKIAKGKATDPSLLAGDLVEIRK